MATIADATDHREPTASSLAPIRVWLYVVAALIVAMVVVGGAMAWVVARRGSGPDGPDRPDDSA